MRIGILASHEGTTLQAIIDACATGVLRAQVVTVVSNNRDAGALQRARAAGIATHHLSSSTHPEPEALDAAICAVLVEHAVDIVVLAGYMKKVGSQTLARFHGRVLNTHPALLPKFGGKGMYGLHIHRAVLAAGEAKSGASVHLVNDEYDSGPVIAQCEVPVAEGDTPEALAERVQVHERELVVEVLARTANGHIRLPLGEGRNRRPTNRLSGPAAPAAQRRRWAATGRIHFRGLVFVPPVLCALLVSVACSSPQTEFPPGDRRIVSVQSLEAFRTSEVGFLRSFAERHIPFWRPEPEEIAACDALLANNSSLTSLKVPLRNYHLQFAGVSRDNERLVLVHGFYPQGPDTTSFTRFGGELTFAPLHTGTCYFEAYCALERKLVRAVTLGTKGR